MIYILIIAYIITAIVAYGGSLAYYQRKYLYIAEENLREDILFCIVISCIPAIGFITQFVFTGGFKYGFKFY